MPLRYRRVPKHGSAAITREVRPGEHKDRQIAHDQRANERHERRMRGVPKRRSTQRHGAAGKEQWCEPRKRPNAVQVVTAAHDTGAKVPAIIHGTFPPKQDIVSGRIHACRSGGGVDDHRPERPALLIAHFNEHGGIVCSRHGVAG